MKCVFIQGQIMLGQNPNPLQIFEGERASEGREILELRTCHSFPPQSTSARRDVEKHPVQRARQSQLNAEQSFEIQSIISSHYQSLVHNFFGFLTWHVEALESGNWVLFVFPSIATCGNSVRIESQKCLTFQRRIPLLPRFPCCFLVPRDLHIIFRPKREYCEHYFYSL